MTLWKLWVQTWTNNWDLHWQRRCCEISESQNGTWRAKPASREVSASILRWCFREENRAGDVGATSNQLQKQKNNFETEKIWNLSKLKNGQNWKFLQVGTENLYNPPVFGRQNPSNPRLWQTVRVTSKLLMDPTNVIALEAVSAT